MGQEWDGVARANLLIFGDSPLRGGVELVVCHLK